MNNGVYDLEGVIWHQHSNRLMEMILKLFPKQIPVLDIGCGINFYASVLKYAGYKAIGIDMVDLGNTFFIKLDISEPFRIDGGVQNVISLEVGEHIPFDKCHTYLDNLTTYKGDIIMSWAVKGQEGVGHINCQDNHWVIEEMHKRGYQIDGSKTILLRGAVCDCHCSWFKNTLMYFTPCE